VAAQLSCQKRSLSVVSFQSSVNTNGRERDRGLFILGKLHAEQYGVKDITSYQGGSGMTPEELQRTMEFIVEQQAKFEAEIQKLFESQRELHETDERLRDSQATLTAALVRLTEIIEENEKRSEERFRKIDERFAALAEAQRKTDDQLRQTDERLNVLVNIVEEHVVRRRNGKKRRK